MSERSETQVSFWYKEKEIILLGTAHVSKESVEEAAAVVNECKPDVLCVELDEARYAALVKKDHWEKLDIIKVIREGKGFLLMANMVLSGFQRRLGNDLGVKPGDEMKAAIDAAQALSIPFVFCDREVQITLRRAWGNCGLWSRCKLLASLLVSAIASEKLSPQEIEDLKNKNELDGMMSGLAAYLPAVKETLIDERDRYLAANISKAADGEGVKRVVAIVGAGHLTGLLRHLETLAGPDAAAAADVSALDVIPPPRAGAKAAKYLAPLLLVGLIAGGFIHSGVNAGMDNLVRWLLWNGSLAALGAACALAHPLAIIVSFFGAPIGTLSPVLSIGFFSGITQAVIRRPRVADAQTLSADAASIKGIYKNRITHVLLVFFLSSLGGAIGNIISIPNLARTFF